MSRLVRKKISFSLIKQEIEKEEERESLQAVLGQMSKHKTGEFGFNLSSDQKKAGYKWNI